MTVKQLEGLLLLLHGARLRVEENRRRWRLLQDTFLAEHAEYRENMALAGEVLVKVEGEVHRMAIALYEADPSLGKTGLPCVTIRESSIYGYDPKTALAWAIEHKVALQLDEAVYRKLIISAGAPGTIVTDLVAAISRDLSNWVAATEAAPSTDSA